MRPENPRVWSLAEVAWDTGDDGDEDEEPLYDEEDLVAHPTPASASWRDGAGQDV